MYSHAKCNFSLRDTLVQLSTWSLFPLSKQIKAPQILSIEQVKGEQRNHMVPSLSTLTVGQIETFL